ncbi:MAG: GDP-L-fucose synthase [Bacteroidales bacterium]|nr:GDP-L-fucose synthase [Bacteroidales bacterium]
MNPSDKIYIAGHLGLVGSAIWKNLQAKGYTNLIGRSIDELDLMDQKAVGEFFKQEKPDYVILAAAKVGGIMANNTYRGQFIYENLQIQNNIIHQAYLNNVKKLLFLGSTCIYPRDCPQPMREDYLLTSPLEFTNEPYAIAKIAGLKLSESYNLQYGTNFLAVMPTNLYGPNDNFDLEKSHVLPALIRKIHLGRCLEEGNWDAIRKDLTKRPIEGITGNHQEPEIIEILAKYGIQSSKSEKLTANSEKQTEYSNPHRVTVEIWGTGSPFREFLWSEEMADACVYLMEQVDFKDLVIARSEETKQSQKPIANSEQLEIRNTHINIGTGKEITIKNLAQLVKETIGFQGVLFFNTSKPDGTMRKLTDPSKLHRLGWHHQIDIEEGIQRLYTWYIAS